MEKSQSDFVDFKDFYFSKTGEDVKNPVLKSIVKFIFNNKVKKKEINCGSFSLNFTNTEAEWHTNFLNEFCGRIKCYFTDGEDMFIVYPVKGKILSRSLLMPEMSKDYLKARSMEWENKGKEWKMDESSVKEEKRKDSYRLQYSGECQEKSEKCKIFEYTVMRGAGKIVLQAFLGKDPKTYRDIEKIADSIRIIF